MAKRNADLADLPERYRKQAEAQLPDRDDAVPVPVAVAAKPESRMNGLEMRYSQLLERAVRRGEVAAWQFEALKLRLADATFYTPDFLVIRHSGHVELHETKGYWREDARVKIKVAAALFPWFRFFAVQEKNGVFVPERF